MKQNRGCERNGDRMKGSRARIVYMTYMYTWSPVYVYILDTYATLLVTRGSPIGLNKAPVKTVEPDFVKTGMSVDICFTVRSQT